MIVPRPAQAETIPKARKALRKEKRALVVLATALGKTIASALIWRGFVNGRGVFLAHSTDILKDAMKDYALVYGPKVKLALYNGSSKDIQGADIIFATFQTMTRNLDLFTRKYFAWMTVDETHHAQAKTFRRVIVHFLCPRLGITATPDRADLLDIRELFGEEVVNIPLEEAIARGWLPKIEYHVVTDEGFDEKALQRITREVMKEGKRLSLQEINRRVFIKARDDKLAKIIEGYNEKTIVFCRNVAHTEHFKRFLRSAESFHSKRRPKQNDAALENLRNGLTRRLLSVNAFNEGINVPDVGLVVFYRTTESETIFRQQLGRGMRPPKEKLIVLDFVGNLQRIQKLKDMADEVARLHEKYTSERERDREGYAHDRMHVSGKGFDFTFSNTVVDLMKVVERVSADFYPTWQEASSATLSLGIKSNPDYERRFREDPRLPGIPRQFYVDYPGSDVFFGRVSDPRGYYPTWEEASPAARKLKVNSALEYRRKRGGDTRLPPKPEGRYKDFPGYDKFLGKTSQRREMYRTWQEAGRAARKLGIRTTQEYFKKYKGDLRLPSNPTQYYPTCPGFKALLKK